MKAYKNPISSLLLRAAASLYYYFKNFITNHLDDTPQVEYTPNIYIEQQKLSSTKETTLINYIIECYQLMLPLDIKFLHYYANKLYRAKGDYTPIKIN